MQDNKLIKVLVLNAQLGNNSAYQQLYQMTVEQIYALAHRLTGDSSSAETLTKKTYIKAWKNISIKDEFSSFADWLKEITVETVLQERNEADHRKKNAGDNNLYDNPFENHIRNLEFQNRLVYVLHDIEKFSFEKISYLSGISDVDFKTLLMSTRENLINLTIK